MKAYVGTAKNPPDSRMPRRLMAISSSTMTAPNSASCPCSGSIALAAYCAAEEIDTATVRM